MRRLRVLTWPVHGAYFNALARVDVDWFVPVKPDATEGYGGRDPAFNLPSNVREVPVEAVGDLVLDLILHQSPATFLEEAEAILGPDQRRLPVIYLEHFPPHPDAVHTRHLVDDPDVLLVHVTHYNRLMWDNGHTPTMVIEHSVAVEPGITYRGHLQRGIAVVSGMQHRPRVAGYDLFLEASSQVPLDAAGTASREYGGLGPIPYRDLHRRVAEYRFLFCPFRYASLPLAVIEAMTMGMPVVALATTELPTVIRDGESGYVSASIQELVERMLLLLADPAEAHRLGANAKEVARRRFDLERFCREWEMAFRLVTSGSVRPARDHRHIDHIAVGQA